jgi:drug/metabolite transporter (DMT)-like permease
MMGTMVCSPRVTAPREHPIGPWLVAIGAGLWGTESAWRIPLNDVFSPNVLVFWEHLILVACALPLILPRLGELRRVTLRTVLWLMFSGMAGSALGAVLFTQALKLGNATVVNVVLNIQPVLSTTAACLLFGDRLGKTFYPWAAIAVVAGMVLVGLTPFTGASVDAGAGFALLCALCWGMSTVAGRAVMVEMSLPLASGLRVVIGLISMLILVAAGGELDRAHLWTAAAASHAGRTVTQLVLLATLSGGVPLVIYFKGLELTRASTAGYFEMMQTLVAVVITWVFFGQALAWYQCIAAVVLIGAVALVQRAQQHTALPYTGPAAIPQAEAIAR